MTDDHTLVHHVELWMDDLALAEQQWGPVLTALGCVPFQHWENGRSWRAGGSYVVIEQSPALEPGGHDRMRAGLNHLALRAPHGAGSADLRSLALSVGWRERVDTGQALHLTDGQGFELELVYDETDAADAAASV
jgi:hypothetical protein